MFDAEFYPIEAIKLMRQQWQETKAMPLRVPMIGAGIRQLKPASVAQRRRKRRIRAAALQQAKARCYRALKMTVEANTPTARWISASPEDYPRRDNRLLT